MTEWIISFDSKVYRIVDALTELKIIDWKIPKNKNVQDGDIIYIYVNSLSRIAYKGAVLKANKPESTIDDSAYFIVSEREKSGKYMEIAVFRVYELDGMDVSSLKGNGLKSNLQGLIKVTPKLANYLHSCDDIQRQADNYTNVVNDTCLVPFPIEVVEECVDKDISLSPLKTSIHKKIIKVTCRACNKEFEKAPRCPHCGQLILYPSGSDFWKYSINGIEGVYNYLLFYKIPTSISYDAETDQKYLILSSGNISFNWIPEKQHIKLDCDFRAKWLIEHYTKLKATYIEKSELPCSFLLKSFEDLHSVAGAIWGNKEKFLN